MARVLPRPRIPLAAVRRWYEEELGWPVTGTEPVELLTGLRFDVLEMPAGAGSAVLRRLPHTGPVALLRAGCDGNHPGDRPKLLMLIAMRRHRGTPGNPGMAGVGRACPGSHGAWDGRPDARANVPHWRSTVIRIRFPGGRAMGATSPARLRGGEFPAHHGVGSRKRGRWGRPRPRTTRERGGDGVPPCPVDACW